ncbi:MAG: hypothetical protein ACP5FL_08225 [Thermoplasmatota archaeon]
MGWTDDPDTEGLFEENFIVAIILGVFLVGTAAMLHFVGISYDPGWFEGQNIFSTMGIIFLIVLLPAIALSTATGRSDLVKWEGLFLIVAVAMIYVASNFDFHDFLHSFSAKFGSWMDINWTVKDLLTIVLIVTLIAMALAAAWGRGVGMGTALLAVICIVGIFLINNPAIAQSIEDGSFFEKMGEATSDMTKGALGKDLTRLAGIGAAGAVAGALIGSAVPGIGTGVGALAGAGCAIAAELLFF